ncbi:hypothetical protein LQZ19_00545 [Treponema primitia]|uniref:hypothetical protein n=1 Tax=Treponema primitia TaxID=88058 RepID=UPI0039800381
MGKREVRFFNTTGPCNPDDHYMLPPAERLVDAQLQRYIEDKLYWVLHAPRQTGKTTFLQSWMREINAGNEAIASYVTVEACQGVGEPEKSMRTICSAIRAQSGAVGVPVPETSDTNPGNMLNDILRKWSALIAPKPLMAEGIKQTLGYRDRFAGANSGTLVQCYLIIFDRRPDKPAWGERIKWLNDADVTVVGC